MIEGTFWRVSGLAETGADLWGGPGNFRELSRKSGKLRGTSGLLFSGRSRGETSGEVQSSGKFWEVRGSMTPSQRLAQIVSKNEAQGARSKSFSRSCCPRPAHTKAPSLFGAQQLKTGDTEGAGCKREHLMPMLTCLMPQHQSLHVHPFPLCCASFLSIGSASSKPTQICTARFEQVHSQREGTNLGVFVPVWLVLPQCEAANLGVFDLCHFDLLKRGCEFGWVWSSRNGGACEWPTLLTEICLQPLTISMVLWTCSFVRSEHEGVSGEKKTPGATTGQKCQISN